MLDKINSFIDTLIFLGKIKLNIVNEKNIKKYIEKKGIISIKLAQWLSNRTDLFPQEYLNELSKLQENVSNHDWEDSELILKKEFIDISFLKIEKIPIGSGSISQVYKAFISDNNEITKSLNLNDSVAIKIIHPNIKKNKDYFKNKLFIKNTIKILSFKKKYRFLKNIDFTYFFNLIESQTDLKNEGKNLDIFLNISNDFPNIIIPKNLYNCSNLIIESFEDGYTIQELKDNYSDKILKEALSLLWWTYMKMILKYNYIHGDIHEGNFRFKIINDKVYLVLYDYGFIIQNNDNEKDLYNNLFDVIFLPNPNEIANFILNSALNEINQANSNKFKADIKAYFESLQAYEFYDRFKSEKLLFILQLGMDPNLRKRYKRDICLITNVLNITIKYNIIIDSKNLNILNGLKMIESLEKKYTDLSNDKFIEFKANYGIKNQYFDVCKLGII